MMLTKNHLTDVIAKDNRFKKKRTTKIVEILLGLTKSCLASDEDVQISGFGKFCVRNKLERPGRNPVTGEVMVLGARRVVTFQCSRGLRDKVNG
jgi:integration host factor subunit alpha